MNVFNHSFFRLVCAGAALVGVLGSTPGEARAEFVPTATLALMAPQLDGKLNVNTATAAQWEMLSGIGPATAAKIVQYRKKYPFKDITHVMRVKGIGRKTFNKIKPHLSLTGETTLKVVGGTGKKSGKKTPK